MNCLFCPAEMLPLREIWCPTCKTHYSTKWDNSTNKSYLDFYRIQNKQDPKFPDRVIFAVFLPKHPPYRAHDSFEIRLFHPNWLNNPTSPDNWEVLAKLDYLPNITPDNFTDKLRIYLPFL